MPLMLSLDSFVLCLALAPVVKRPALYAILFGICDAIGSAVHVSMSGLAVPPLLFVYGLAMLLVAIAGASGHWLVRGSLWVVPALCAVDNIASGAVPSWQAGLVSCAMAGLGLLLGGMMARTLSLGYRSVMAATMAAAALQAAHARGMAQAIRRPDLHQGPGGR